MLNYASEFLEVMLCNMLPDAIVRHLGLYKQKQPSQRVPPKRPSAPPGQGSRNRKKEGAEETEKLKCRSTPSPQNSFFSSLQWQDCSDTQQDIPQSNFVTEVVKNDSQHFEGQPVQHPGLRRPLVIFLHYICIVYGIHLVLLRLDTENCRCAQFIIF